jgi:2-methylcitrate dehydratase
MIVKEDPQFTKDYYDLSKRAIPNAIQIEFKDGSFTDWVEEYYPIGHPKRREEGLPLLKQKFLQNLRSYYPEEQINAIKEVFLGSYDWLQLPLDEFYRIF